MVRNYMLNPTPVSLKVEKSVKDFYEKLAVLKGASFNETVSDILVAVKGELESKEEVLTNEAVEKVAKDIVVERFFAKIFDIVKQGKV